VSVIDVGASRELLLQLVHVLKKSRPICR
jgi:hypothetical protein